MLLKRLAFASGSKLRLAGHYVLHLHPPKPERAKPALRRPYNRTSRQRVAEHNAGKCPHTSKFLPWKLKVYIAFESIEQAQHFEKYLKSGSGGLSRTGISGAAIERAEPVDPTSLLYRSQPVRRSF